MPGAVLGGQRTPGGRPSCSDLFTSCATLASLGQPDRHVIRRFQVRVLAPQPLRMRTWWEQGPASGCHLGRLPGTGSARDQTHFAQLAPEAMLRGDMRALTKRDTAKGLSERSGKIGQGEHEFPNGRLRRAGAVKRRWIPEPRRRPRVIRIMLHRESRPTRRRRRDRPSPASPAGPATPPRASGTGGPRTTGRGTGTRRPGSGP